MNEWISVKDRLPVIPKDRFAVHVLAAVLDHGDDSYSVRQVTFCPTRRRDGKLVHPEYNGYIVLPDYDFVNLGIDNDGNWHWELIDDVVTHWMYMPAPPSNTQEKRRCEIEL